MTRNEHLKFCSICENRKLNFQQGLLCQLTNEKANFEGECAHFKKDDEEEERLLLLKLELAGYGSEGDPVDFKKNKTNDQIIGFIGAGIFLFTLLYPSPIIIIPFGAIFYGVHLYRKGVEQEKMFLEEEKKPHLII